MVYVPETVMIRSGDASAGAPVPVVLAQDDGASPLAAERRTVLFATLGHLPARHLEVVTHPGRVEARREGHEPRSGGGHQPLSGGKGIARLSAASFGARYNREINCTLLHELGHLMDSAFGLIRRLQARRSDYRFMAAAGHEGSTHGSGERIADAYLVYSVMVLAGRSYTHPADPAAYQGADGRRRMQILAELLADAGAPFHRTP